VQAAHAPTPGASSVATVATSAVHPTAVHAVDVQTAEARSADVPAAVDLAAPLAAAALATPNGAAPYADAPPNLDAMVSALLAAEAHAAAAQAQAQAEAQVAALEIPVPAPVPAGLEPLEEEAGQGAAEHAPHVHRRSSIRRIRLTPSRTRHRLVYLAAGIMAAIFVVAVLSWMEWWDLSAVSLPDPE
jgi:hypothetical protein